MRYRGMLPRSQAFQHLKHDLFNLLPNEHGFLAPTHVALAALHLAPLLAPHLLDQRRERRRVEVALRCARRLGRSNG